MKTNFFASIVFVLLCFTTQAQDVNIPDANFLNALIDEGIDTNNDGKIQVSEASVVTSLKLNNKIIASFKGIEMFTNLTNLNCSANPIISLDVSKNTALTELNCSSNPIRTLDVSKNIALTSLNCIYNELSTLDVSKNTALTSLNCSYNQLNTLDVTKNTALTVLCCIYNQLSTLDVSKNTALMDLNCSHNQLSTLDVSKNTALNKLECYYNQLSTLEVSKNIALMDLNCPYNQLSTLDVSKNTALTSLNCNSNQLSILDVSKNTALTSLGCSNNQLNTLDVSKNTVLTDLYCNSNQLSILDVSKNTALTNLDCSGNQLSNLDVSKNTTLTFLNCSSNPLSTVDVSKNTSLTELFCYSNQLSILDVSKNNALTSLGCSDNQLSTLNISTNIALTELSCSSNKLSTLDISTNIALTRLGCGDNKLSTLDLSKNSALTSLDCSENQLSTLDVSKNTKLVHLYIYNNPLNCLSFLPKSIGKIEKDPSLCLPNLPNSTFTLTDKKFSNFPKILCTEAYNSSNQCTSYPNTSGRIYIDVNKDKQYTQGTDYPMSNVVIGTTYETNTDAFGKYGFRVDNLNQTYMIQPALPAGWLSSPDNYTFSFKNMGEVLEGKDFIVIPPVLNDVWVEASPVTFARPGFVVKYQVKVKNLGGTVQNGSVQLNYPANFTFLSSTPAGNNLNTTHTWSAASLLPFEERIYTIEFTLSAETPLGTELVSTATISIPNDGNLVNNVSEIKQTVRGSYDPNDKLLNKGNTVLRSSIQAQEDFVYTIRFQNTGTDTAFRVIIRDTLALNKFDLKSMQTIASSHPYTLKYEGNFLNWTFNDILLPDSTTDKVGSNGFVKFKIKPLSTLAVDDEIKNKAAIYFDFNKAVITNTVNTRVSNTTNVSESTIPTTQIFPNPSSGLFTIRGVNDVLVQVLTTTGTIILTQNISENGVIDLRTAAKGIYCLKIRTTNKTEISKVVIE